MKSEPIETGVDYAEAVAEIARYFDREPDLGTEEAARFDLLATLIESYEARHWPI
jgi:HTH-type transcriptional regulator/antitoxin HigA